MFGRWRRRSGSTVAALLVLVGLCWSCSSALPSLPSLSDSETLPPGQPYRFEISGHCGFAVLSRPVNGTLWRTDEAAGSTTDWIPAEWRSENLEFGDQLLTIEVRLSAEGTQLTASHGGRSVQYRPVNAADPESFCM